MFRFMWHWDYKRKSPCEMLRQITFFRVSQVPKRFSVAILWNFQCVKCLDKHLEQDDGRRHGGWKAEFQERSRKNEHACSMEGVFVVLDLSACLKVAGPTRIIQNSSKLRQVRKWQAEIPDTPLGLTGIGDPRGSCFFTSFIFLFW